MTHDDNFENTERTPRRHRPARPHISPSSKVHIGPTRKPSGTAMWSGPNHWITEGYELRDLISMLYGIAETRIEFLAVEPNARYDLALVLPHDENETMLFTRIQKALERELQLVASRVTAARAVYVVTAPNGPGPKLVPAETLGGGSIATSTTIVVPKGVSPSEELFQEILNRRGSGTFVDTFSMSFGTVSDLFSILESSLDQPVINESRLHGYFEAKFTRQNMTKEQIFQIFREAFGLVITPQMRDVESLRVHRD
jgi:uncharacterized protein (TIGR03435 family)